jgi:hypothetical protein
LLLSHRDTLLPFFTGVMNGRRVDEVVVVVVVVGKR